MEPYQYIDGQVLVDKNGMLCILREEARQVYYQYRMNEADREAIHHWLYSAKIKIQAAIEAGDAMKASFITATTSYKILEGIWGVCNKPIPPAGAVLAHMDDLVEDIPHIKEWLKTLFLGSLEERNNKAVELMDWVNKRILNC
jgi:hypothetical protein